jgi:hypothetical protein
MTGEIDIYGVLFPPLLVWLGLALILSAGVRLLHRPLFDLAILVILTGCVAALLNPS